MMKIKASRLRLILLLSITLCFKVAGKCSEDLDLI